MELDKMGNSIAETSRTLRYNKNEGSTPQDILQLSKGNGLVLSPREIKALWDTVPALVQNWDESVYVEIFGDTSAGKSKFTRGILTPEVADRLQITLPGESEAVSVLKSEPSPDATPWIVRVPFKNGVVFYDHPGFNGDDHEISNISRASANLEQLGPPACHVSEIRYIDTARKPLAIEHTPISEWVMKRDPLKDQTIALYLFNMTLNPFGPAQQESTRHDVLALYETYGANLIIGLTFKDVFEGKYWQDPKRRKNRKEILKYALATDVIGSEPIECSGLTGEGLSSLVKRIFAVSGGDTAKIRGFIDEELRGSRFEHARLNLAKLVAGGLIRNDFATSSPREDLFNRLVVICGVFLQEYYSVNERTWEKHQGKIENIMTSECETVEARRVRRAAVGWWEKVKEAVFRKKFITTRYSVTLAPILSLVCELYELIHELEPGIKSEKVAPDRVKAFFAAAFQEQQLETAISELDQPKVQLALEKTLTDFFATFHRESLDIKTQLLSGQESPMGAVS